MEHYERSEERVTQRNGYRKREWDTRLDTIELNIPKLRKGSFVPSILGPRHRSKQALAAMVQEAYVHGVSTRKVDELVRALGWTVSARARSPACARSWMRPSDNSRNGRWNGNTPWLAMGAE